MIDSRRRPSWNLVSHGIIRIYCAYSVSVCISSVSRLDAGFCTKPLNTEFVCTYAISGQ